MTQKKSSSAKPVQKVNPQTKWVKWIWMGAAFPVVLLATMLTLTALGIFGRLPSFEELENPKSNLATEIYSEDGQVIGSFYVQNRSYVQYADLFSQDSTKHIYLDGYDVPAVVAALISTEDVRYRSHSGIDIKSLFRVGIKTIAMQNTSQGGGSTISQQLAKNLFPRDTVRSRGKVSKMAKLITSKFKEWITALRLETNYTKEEIATMYLNTVEYGSNAYGIKSSAQTFFGKYPSELNIQEAALLVGVVNAPTRYSPVRNPQNALNRRNTVIARMASSGAITNQMRDSISALPITLNYKPISHNEGTATYFREMLRLTMTAQPPKRNQFYTEWDYNKAKEQYESNPIYGWCHKNKKADGSEYNIYRDGLKIYTTINSRMQRYAEQAVQKQMEETVQPRMDAQVKATGVLFQETTKAQRDQIYHHAMIGSDRYYQMKRAGKSDAQIEEFFANTKVDTRIFTYKGERDTVITPRDSILHHKRIMRASMVAADPRTGAIKAYVGGPNFRYFKYDMAKQGKRQMGSTIKPFIYTFAIDHLGLTPCTPVPNLPVTIETANGTAWSPKEAGKVEYTGELKPLRYGLAASRNNYSAWIMKQAKRPEAVAEFIHNMGVDSYVDPVPALCLGSSESNVFELVGAYSTFANSGVHNESIFVTSIEDRQGNLIASFIPESQDAINEQTAYTMITMLQNVVNGGTANRLRWMYDMTDMEVGGKTGTSQRGRDAWFMCVMPKIVAGSWVGGEDQSVHFSYGGEGGVVALPIVGEFLRKCLDDPKLDIDKLDQFPRPAEMPSYDCEEAYDKAQEEAEVKDDEFFN